MADALADIIESLRSSDSKERRNGFANAEAYLDYEQVDVALAPDLVDTLLPALSDANSKFVQGSLGLLIVLVEVMGEDLAPYVGNVWTPLVERLGDAKAANRERAVDLVVALSTMVVAAGAALEKLRSGWEHKNWRVRESTLLWFGRLLAQHDSPAALGFSLRAQLSTMVKLLEDREPPVREAAMVAVEQMHRHLGDPFLNELHRQSIRPTTLKPLMQRLAPSDYGGGVGRPPALAVGDGDADAGEGGSNGGGGDMHSPSAMRDGGGSGHGDCGGACEGVARPAVANRRSPVGGGTRQAGSGPPSARRSGPATPGGRGSTATGNGGSDGDSYGNASGGGDGEVTPRPVYSERELVGEIEKVGEQLRHTSDWAVRSGALRKLHGLVLGGACEFGSFMGHFKGLREPLVAQCSELRSSLVREACALLVCLAATLREQFEPFCHYYFPPLLKQTVVTIQIIREASNECLRAMLIYATPTRLTPRLVAACADRAASLRKNGIEYLLLLLDVCPAVAEGERASGLERHADAITQCLKQTLTDALAEVRGTSRSCVWALHRHFPSRVGLLLPSLDTSTHKLVVEEQVKYASSRANGEGPSMSGVVHGGSRGVIARSDSAPGLRAHTRVSSLSKGSGGVVAPPPPAEPPQRDHAGVEFAAAADSDARGGGYSRGGRYSQRAAESAARAAAAQRGGGCGVAPRNSGVGGGGEAPAAPACAQSMGRQPPAAPSASQSGLRNRAEADAGGRREAAEAAAVASFAAYAMTADDGVDDESPPPPLPLEDVLTVLGKSGSSVWSVRAQSCNELAALMISSRRRSELAPLAEKISDVLLERLSDPHYKVVHAALACSASFATTFPHVMEPQLERFLPQLFLRGLEAREVVREAATSAVVAVQSTFPPESLMPVVLRVLDVNLPRCRAAALQLLGACALGASQHIAMPSHMRQCVSKCHPHLADKNAELRRAALSALHALHTSASHAFLSHVSTLPNSLQNAIKTLMMQRAPTIEVELANAKQQSNRRAVSAGVERPSTAQHLPLPSGTDEPPLSAPAGDDGGGGVAAKLSCARYSHAPPPHARPPQARHGAIEAELPLLPPPKAPHSPPPSASAVSVSARTSAAPAIGSSAPPPSASALGELSCHDGAISGTPDPALRPLQPSHTSVPNQQAGLGSLHSGSSLGGLASNHHKAGPEEWLALMPTLLRQLAGNAAPPTQREALGKLQKMAFCEPADAPVWVVHFEHTLEAVLRAVQHPDDKLRELAMATVKDLLRSQQSRFKAFTEHVLLRLLAAGRDPSRDVAFAAEEALEFLVSISDTHRCMAVLVPVMMKEGPPTLQLAVRLQSRLVPRFSQLQLLAILPQVLPPLFEAFKNPHADVRKAVVFCLVDMYMVLGEKLTPHLAVLSTSQLKLVTIYINRTARARADRTGNSPPSMTAATPAIE